MDYGVTIERAVGEWVWRAEVRHLTPEENKGRHRRRAHEPSRMRAATTLGSSGGQWAVTSFLSPVAEAA